MLSKETKGIRRKEKIANGRRKVKKEKERLDNSKVIISRDNQEIIIEEALKTHEEIPSNDPVFRQEAINKETNFIRKKWSEMEQEQLEKKLKLEKEIYDNDCRFEMFKEIEKDLILAIALGDFRLKLNKNDIRNAVKTEVWKTALRELKQGDWDPDVKKLLMHYKFGSLKKNNKKNYLMQLGDKMISMLYVMEQMEYQQNNGKNQQDCN
jgi:hypothetical protein